MPIGEFTKYGLVFSSSLIGAVSGYFYSSKPLNLRMRMERKGTRLLRSSDPLWMYSRILKQKKSELKDIVDAPESTDTNTKTDEQKLKTFANGNTTEPTDEEAIALLNWCERKLSIAKYSSSWENDVATFCEFPKWSQ